MLMRRFFIFIALLALPSALASEVQTAVASGVAYGTGVSTELSKKRAIIDALENFMLQNGANFSSLTILENGVIKLDQLKVSSETRVLGFNVLNELVEGDKFTVDLKILYGNFDQKDKCERPQKLLLSYPKVIVKHAINLPPYLSNISVILQDQIKAIAARHKNLNFVNVKTITLNKLSTNLADYTSIVSSQVSDKKNSDDVVLSKTEHSLEVVLDLEYNEDSNLLTGRFWPTSNNVALSANLERLETRASTTKLALTLPFKKVPRNRSKIVAELLGPFLVSLEKSIELAVCSPKSAKLRQSGKFFKINLGRDHGIQKDSVFLLQNGQPTGFVVKTLDAKQSTLQALEGMMPQSSFDGEIVYLLQ